MTFVRRYGGRVVHTQSVVNPQTSVPTPVIIIYEVKPFAAPSADSREEAPAVDNP
jgi:hypothetical protein